MNIAIIGGGPAGLMAAEAIAAAGLSVTLFDGMPSVGRKFLMAGKGGMNITHSEPLPDFVGRYGARAGQLAHFNEAEWRDFAFCGTLSAHDNRHAGPMHCRQSIAFFNTHQLRYVALAVVSHWRSP